MREIQINKPYKFAISINSVFAFFSAVIVILNSGYYRSTTNDSYIPLILLMCFVAVGLLIKSPKHSRQRISLVLILLSLGILFSVVANFNMSNVLSGFRVFVTMLCSYILVFVVTPKEFIKNFTLQMKVIIILSTIMQVLLLLGVSNFPTINEYKDLIIITGRTANRACGVFWEPGVFASMIIISMLLEYYIGKRKITIFGIALYALGIYITKSTAGYLLLFIVLFGLIWQKFFNSRNSNKRPFYLFLFIVVIAVLLISYEYIFEFLFKLNPNVFGKLIETNSETTSTRLNGPLINLQVFAEQPLFGWGFTGSATKIFDIMNSNRLDKVVAQTSTSTQIMASIGIFGAAYSLGFVLPIFQKKKISHLIFEAKVIVAACMLLIVNKEPHVFIVASWLVLFYIQCIEDFGEINTYEQ